MSQDEAIAALEKEIEILNTDVKPQLLDIRQRYLEYKRPFRLDKPGPALGQAHLTRGEWSPRRGPDSKYLEEEAEMTGSGQASNEQAGMQREAATETEKASAPSTTVYRGRRRPGDSSLITIAGLAQWVEEAVACVGKQRLEALVEVCQMFGHLQPGEKDVILRLVRSSSCESDGERATARDYLSMLIRLQNVLGNSTRSEDALMAILSADDSGRGDRAWIR